MQVQGGNREAAQGDCRWEEAVRFCTYFECRPNIPILKILILYQSK